MNGGAKSEVDLGELEPFSAEVHRAVASFDRFVVCLDRPPDQFMQSLLSLLSKALLAYRGRPEGSRHGVACDQFVTVIISHDDPPLCGIYFNLSSPYAAKSLQNAK